MSSHAQLAANRANAKLSSGPTSEIGKATSSLNAVKTGLTGRTVVLPSDQAAEYERHVLAYEKELRPVDRRECDLVQSIADLSWRLQRIPALEMSIYARGHIEFADQVQDYDVALRPGMIELQTFLAYEKQLRNLQLQESRLARRRERDLAELRNLQREREHREAEQMAEAVALYLSAQHANKPFHPAEFGFEFSVSDIERHLERARREQVARAALKQPIGQAPGREAARKHVA